MPSTIESLRKLHPPSSGHRCPNLPDAAPRIHVDGIVLSALVSRKVANGSAPGPSGWTGELVKALVGDADCLAGLVTLVEDIVNGDLDESARKFLLSSSLIAGFWWVSAYCYWSLCSPSSSAIGGCPARTYSARSVSRRFWLARFSRSPASWPHRRSRWRSSTSAVKAALIT